MDWKQKLTSRKFWAAIVNFVTQLMIAFGASQNAAVQVAAVIMAGAGVIAYIVGEGLADAAGAQGDVYVTQEVVKEPPDELPPEMVDDGK